MNLGRRDEAARGRVKESLRELEAEDDRVATVATPTWFPWNCECSPENAKMLCLASSCWTNN